MELISSHGGANKWLDEAFPRNYGYYMTELKVSRIGNSRGIRLSASLLKRYRIGDSVLLEEGEDSITLRPKLFRKLSWKETAAEMAKAREDWTAFETSVDDGLDSL